MSPIEIFIREQGAVVLDGGLATELERRGFDLDHPLWSARLMLTDPDVIKDVHLSFLNAGADCIISASYQASYAGCLANGMSENEVTEMLRETVTVAEDARREFLKTNKDKSRLKPLIAASIGPYGAYLANGAEYTGDYYVPADELYDFHARRWKVLGGTNTDLLACETIPSFQEAGVILKLLEQTPEKYAYVSFSCANGKNISDGTAIRDCASLFAEHEQIVAVGINCTSPVHISSLIGEIKKGAPEKPVVVYPNSGEVYDGTERNWKQTSAKTDFAGMSVEWLKKGALLIGGCCRTQPKLIRKIRKKIKRNGE